MLQQYVSDIGELWDVLPLRTRVSAVIFLLNFILLSALACLSCVSLHQRFRSKKTIRGVLAFLVCTSSLSWIGTAPSASIVERSGFAYASTLSKLSQDASIFLEDCNSSTRKWLSREVCFASCAAGGGCYPRLRGLCVSSIGASACDSDLNEKRRLQIHVHVHDTSNNLVLQYRNCTSLTFGKQDVSTRQLQTKWHRGTSIVLDSVFQDANSGHIFHEMEKLATALYMMGAFDKKNSTEVNRSKSQETGLQIAQMFWFTHRASLSIVTQRMIETFFVDKSKIMDAPWDILFSHFGAEKGANVQHCFEDAILVQSGHGTVTPSTEATDALRDALMLPCGLDPNVRASHPALTALVMNRAPPRCFANRQLLLSNVRKVVSHVYEVVASDSLAFCDQVRAIVDADIIISPHGSQHALFLFAKKEAIIIEVQPYLYFDANNIMFLHRAGMGFRIHESMGTPNFKGSITHRLFLHFGWHKCMSSHACRARTRKVSVMANITDITVSIKAHDIGL